MTVTTRKRRARRRRRNLNLVKIAVIIILVGALIAMGLLLFRDEAMEQTVTGYPMKYTDLIRSYAAEQGLEPAYVAAVIMAESGYDPMAESDIEARGLMQIMPDTAEWIAGKFGDDPLKLDLFDPETNIRYGTWYLGFLMDRYGGDKRCSSSAYHSGQGTVDKWLKDPAHSADGKTLDVIDGDLTIAYVSKVLEYYEKYEELYAEDTAA